MQDKELKTDGPNKHFSGAPTAKLEPFVATHRIEIIVSAGAGDSFHKSSFQTDNEFIPISLCLNAGFL